MNKKNLLMNGLAIIMAATLNVSLVSCGDDDDDVNNMKVTQLPKMDNISLNYHATSKTVTLDRDVETEGAAISLKKGVSWINNIQLSGKILSFDVEENTMTTIGHRFDTIIISVKGIRIGSVCVTQARDPFSSSRLVWANSDALYSTVKQRRFRRTGNDKACL